MLILVFCPKKPCFNKSTILVKKVITKIWPAIFPITTFWNMLNCHIICFLHLSLNLFELSFIFKILINDLCIGIVILLSLRYIQHFFLASQLYIEKDIHIRTDVYCPALANRKFSFSSFSLCSKYKNSKLQLVFPLSIFTLY